MAEELTTTEETNMVPGEPSDAPAGAEAGEAAEEDEKKGWVTSLLSPEAVTMLFLAGFVDGGEFLVDAGFTAVGLPGVGSFLTSIIDIVALLFIGGWMYFRSGTTESKQKAERIRQGIETVRKGVEVAEKAAKTAKWAKLAKWLKYGSVVFEMTPFVSSFFPGWILSVILELKYGSS